MLGREGWPLPLPPAFLQEEGAGGRRFNVKLSKYSQPASKGHFGFFGNEITGSMSLFFQAN